MAVDRAPAEPSRFRRAATRLLGVLTVALPVAPVLAAGTVGGPTESDGVVDGGAVLLQAAAIGAVLLLAMLLVRRLLALRWAKHELPPVLTLAQACWTVLLALAGIAYTVGVTGIGEPTPFSARLLVQGLIGTFGCLLALVVLATWRPGHRFLD